MWMDRGRTQAVLAKAVVLGAISFSGVVSVTAPANAQFLGPWFGPRAVPIERDEVIPPRLVARIVHAQGFRMTDYPSRRGDRIIALGVDDRGQVRRFVLDAYDGAIVNTSLIGAPRPPGYIGGDRGAYAYGAPDIDQPIEAVPKPKRKPKVKTAAKHPAPLPQAAPASPEAPPSQATQAPPSVAPAPSTPAAAVPAATPAPPVAATPPATPPAATPVAPAATVSTPAVSTPAVSTPAAPPTVADAPPPTVRPAPDAQPRGDIGPKVVPVKPAEARAPEPEAWDTEAQPKAQQAAPLVTPEQANSMAPERHEDK